MSVIYLFVFFFKGELLLFDDLQLVTEVELGGLLLELGEFVLVFGHLLQCGFDAGKEIDDILGTIITQNITMLSISSFGPSIYVDKIYQFSGTTLTSGM